LNRIRHRVCGKTLEFIRLEDGSLCPRELVGTAILWGDPAGRAEEQQLQESTDSFDGADPLRRAGNGHFGVLLHTTDAMQPGLDSAPPKSFLVAFRRDSE
jgi:hypothetical protein